MADEPIWRVDVFVSSSECVHVRAPSEESAIGRVRERLAVDRLPSHYSTVGRAQLVADNKFIAVGRSLDAPPEVEDGRVHLTADEASYCERRGYSLGPDIDAFDGIQWIHLVDDGVALCRTTALWGSGMGLNEDVSCPFCVEVLRRELLYPMPRLQVLFRRSGRRAVASVTREGDEAILRVRGVEVKRASGDASHELTTMARAINDAEPDVEEVVPPRPMRAGGRSERIVRYLVAVLALRALEEAEVRDEDRIRDRSAEVEGFLAVMAPDEVAVVDAYLER